MPLKPNLIERQLLKRGTIPPLLMDIGAGPFVSAALVGALETGVLEELGRSPGTPLEPLAERTGTDPGALDTLLAALEGVGYVEARDGGWALTGAAERSLPREELDRLAPFLKAQTTRNLEDAGRALREAPEDGVVGWDLVREGEVAESYQALMRWLAGGSVDEVTGRARLPDGARRLLDVGGSHGLYTVALCRRHPDLTATILDWPVGLREAERTLAGEGSDVADRVDLASVDFEREELPGGYDVAFLGNIVHGLSLEGNAELFGKLSRATTERGTLLILDQLRGGRRGSQFARGLAALVGWNLFLFSGGRSHRLEELGEALGGAGFTSVRRTDLRRTPGFSVVTAGKPAG